MTIQPFHCRRALPQIQNVASKQEISFFFLLFFIRQFGSKRRDEGMSTNADEIMKVDRVDGDVKLMWSGKTKKHKCIYEIILLMPFGLTE